MAVLPAFRDTLRSVMGFCFILSEMIFHFANLDFFHLTALDRDKYRNPTDF